MSGIDRIAAERDRHEDLGYTAEHDVQHVDSELLGAAICYVVACDPPTLDPAGDLALSLWPWGNQAWKPSANRIRNLEKAGALIAAEIDRLQAEANATDDLDV
jgi:hypothetical protein